MLQIEAIFRRFWIFVRMSSLSRGKNCSPPISDVPNPKKTGVGAWGDGDEALSRPEVGRFCCFLPVFCRCPQQIWKTPQLMKFHYFEPNVWFWGILVVCPPYFGHAGLKKTCVRAQRHNGKAQQSNLFHRCAAAKHEHENVPRSCFLIVFFGCYHLFGDTKCIPPYFGCGESKKTSV